MNYLFMQIIINNKMNNKIRKVIIWGYPLHSHTHSYIHAAFYKAFKHLGYETFWFEDKPLNAGDFESCLFITGTQDKHIPIVKSSYYVLHYVDDIRKYEGCKNLFIQHSIPVDTDNCEMLNKCCIIQHNHDIDCLYLAWATNLLPHEINLAEAVNKIAGEKNMIWIGTYGDSVGPFQNGTILHPFFDACRASGIKVQIIDPWTKPVSFEENRKLVNDAYLAPALMGPFQVNNGYIPCRIFKNISYGHMGITNSAIVNRLFDDALVYDADPIALFHKSLEFKNSPDAIDKIRSLMTSVRDNHTYLNRIELILKCLPE